MSPFLLSSVYVSLSQFLPNIDPEDPSLSNEQGWHTILEVQMYWRLEGPGEHELERRSRASVSSRVPCVLRGKNAVSAHGRNRITKQ